MRRPFGVTIIGALVLAQGLGFSLLGSLATVVPLAAEAGLLPPAVVAALPALHMGEEIRAVGALMLGSFGLVSGIGLLRQRPWAWLMAMILQGINLTNELFSYARGSAIYPNMALSVLIVLYLNARDIQRAFSAAQHRDDPESRRTADADQAAAAEAQREVAGSR
jgi:uncharacterized membrane protein (DUF2068 family)